MKFHLHILAIGALGFGLAACGGGNVTTPISRTNTTQYTQIELLSRPAVKELFEKFVDHQTSNAVEPYADPTLQGEIQTFTDALRPPSVALGTDYGKALAGILYPNEMTADLSQTGVASYLGVETGGATGGKFGGRAVTDDVIDISLGAVFGNTLPSLHVSGAAEDNQENNCLTTDNVAQNVSQAPTAVFPYLHGPH
jgi:hypothetical protein